MSESNTPAEVRLTDGLGPNAQTPARDPHRGGHSYEASMLRTLLARIHGDGGHYVEEHGLDKALEDAEAKVAALLATPDVQWLQDHKAALEYQERRYKWAGPPHWRLSWGDYCIVRMTPQACIAEARAIQALGPNVK